MQNVTLADLEANQPASALVQRLSSLRREIAATALEYGRKPEDVALIAVSKFHPAEAVRWALAAQQRLFGENRVQEAMAKFVPLRDEFPDLELHLIGPLQTNKIKEAVRTFDVIEVVDRPKLAEALAAAMDLQDSRVRHCLIQVNTGEEPQKAGVFPADADAFIRHCRERLGLPITGLMAIPPVGEEASLHFALLRAIARRNGLSTLSMGMSNDYRLAIQQGATHLRIGTSLFGERPAASPADHSPGT